MNGYTTSFQFRLVLNRQGEFLLGFSLLAFVASAVLAMCALWTPFPWRIVGSVALVAAVLVCLALTNALDNSIRKP